MRDQIWLESRLDNIWKVLMPEVERKNKVIIRFKGRWKNKFGHIKKLNDGSSEIVVNSFFRHLDIPEYIIDTTIAHELVHYMHGFQSPYPRQYKHPHKGNIVNKELNKRGFEMLLKLEKEWIKTNWKSVYLSLA
ncbi:hypothetical protein J4438_02365 [Candidatus Woesearchaeota archaeon]|nr:hypothetical protein [Candidatus Woesearchaeota archaeon]